MKHLFYLLAGISSVLFISAGILAYQGKDGWGWFLFAGILLIGSLPYKEEE